MDMIKKGYGFGYLDLIFKVTLEKKLGKKLIECALS